MLKEVTIRNFKSIKNLSLSINKNQTIIGNNFSGKTNFLDFFKMIKNLQDTKVSTSIFAEWFGFQNTIHQYDPSKAIFGKLKFEHDNYVINYSISIRDPNSQIDWLDEEIEIEGYLKIRKVVESHLEITYQKKFQNIAQEEIIKTSVLSEKIKDTILDKVSKGQLIKTLKSISGKNTLFGDIFLAYVPAWETPLGKNSVLLIPRGNLDTPRPLMDDFSKFSEKSRLDKFSDKIIIMPTFKSLSGDNSEDNSSYSFGDSYFLSLVIHPATFIDEILILKGLNLKAVKKSFYPGFDPVTSMGQNGENLVGVIYASYLRRENIIETIEEYLEPIYPVKIQLDLSRDGAILFSLKEGRDEQLLSANISDGFYKMLFILTSLLQKPSLLLIDEIENSLHKNSIDLLLSAIKNSEVQSIITTHSPLIIDRTNLEKLWIFSRSHDRTKAYSPKLTDDLKEKIRKIGYLQSEAWYEGLLDESS